MDFWHFMFLFKGSVVRWQARQTGFLHRVFSRRRRASHSGPLTLAGPSPSPGGLSPGWGLWCQLWRLGSDEVSGVTVTKFQLDDDVFANGTVCNKNSCYENNLPTGVQVWQCFFHLTASKYSSQNVTQCKGKSPAFLSRPHFFKADEYFTK